MGHRRVVTRLLLVALAACVHDARPAPSRRLGDAMIEVGMRFERVGRAILASRWQLARYDLAELSEVFGEDLPRSGWLGKPEVARLARTFDAEMLAPLRDAVQAKDRTRCEAAFIRAARACNACHAAAHFGFIEIPATLGSTVPAIESLVR